MKSLRIVASLALILSFVVVLLGAYTRLTDAGLGCPDWPGCYGHMVLPHAKAQLQVIEKQYPTSPVESKKAWTEMIHRYAAGTLALLILWMAWYRARHYYVALPQRLPTILVLLVMFQAALGMWTVTLKLLPVVVMGHLLGGLLIFSSLTYWRWQLSPIEATPLPALKRWVTLGVVIVFCQIALGGWVSSNYAGIACVGFPRCNGTWWPQLHWKAAFDMLSPIGANYQGGVLENEVRVTIQWVHRLGAVLTAGYVLLLSLKILMTTTCRYIKWVATLLVLLVIVQFLLGIANVYYLLPLAIAVAHNGVAALLLATMVSLRYLITSGRQYGGR